MRSSNTFKLVWIDFGTLSLSRHCSVAKTTGNFMHVDAANGRHLSTAICAIMLKWRRKCFEVWVNCPVTCGHELTGNSPLAFYLCRQLAFHHWPAIKSTQSGELCPKDKWIQLSQLLPAVPLNFHRVRSLHRCCLFGLFTCKRRADQDWWHGTKITDNQNKW